MASTPETPAARQYIDFGRQLDIFNPDNLKDEITIVGAGGIGSPTTMVLTKMGCPNVTVFDADTVALHNLPSQLYRIEDLDKAKVQALKEIVADFIGTEITAKSEWFESQALSGIVICATDSMESRKKVFARAKYNPRVKLFIDARMGGQVARIYAIKPCDLDDIRFYESTLYTDEQASAERCTEKAIAYNVFVIAGLIGDLVRKYAVKQDVPKEILLDLVNLALLAK